MNKFLSSYPTDADDRVFTSYDIWTDIINKPAFRIYNDDLLCLITDFYKLWSKSISICTSYFTSTPTKHRVIFYGLEHDIFTSDAAEKAFGDIIAINQKMLPILKELAIYILDHYEIDVEQTSRKFIKALE